MIRFLSIRNLAVIDALEVEFGPGLNVLTGETGAGKSIVVEAVGLLVGERASADLVRTGEDTAVVQAIVEPPEGGELIVRREVSAQGRSRAFIDDELVTTAALRERCGPFVDLHGQHEHQRLLDPATHVDLVDEFADLGGPRAAVGDVFVRWRTATRALDALQLDERQKAARIDLLTFQLAEIDRAAPRPGEDAELATARVVLANADRLQRLSGETYAALYEGDQPVLGGLGVVWRKIEELGSLDPRFAPYLESREPIKAQLEDLAYFLRSYAASIDASPARLQEVEDRLALLERVKRKHGPTLDDVLARQEEFRRELSELESAGARLESLQAAAHAARADYLTAARSLSAARRSAAGKFARTLEQAVAELAMLRTKCEVRFAPETPEGAWTDRGIDQAEFYLSPNPGEELRPLARIASGGELSRLMLALKTLAPTDAPGKTLVFDEVDVGIGGAVADVVGNRLQRLGARYQVLCITHLPQIAAHGRHHFRIENTVRGSRTVTSAVRVDGSTREEELARMIGGSDISASVLASARDMLRARALGEQTAKGERESSKPKGRRVG